MKSPSIERKTVSVPQAAVILGIGRSYAYAMAHTGELPGVRKIGSRYIVSRRELEEYLNGDAA